MKNHPYDDLPRDKMVLRDWLAMDRTIFAAARTGNDYLKTFLTGIIATLVFIALFRGDVWDALLYIGFMIAAIILVGGVVLGAQTYHHHRNLHHEP